MFVFVDGEFVEPVVGKRSKLERHVARMLRAAVLAFANAHSGLWLSSARRRLRWAAIDAL